MPVENEIKYALRDPDGALERALAAMGPPVTRNAVRQAYLDAPGLRIRRFEGERGVEHVFSFKRAIGGEMVEVETSMDAADFERLWTLRQESLEKVRFHLPAGECGWDVDFFKDGGATYFALAEVEMPVDRIAPPEPPAFLQPFIAFAVAPGDGRFTSRKLADVGHARGLVAEYGL
ncbi:MAG: hypothetical protein JNL07_09590 [Rhodospirillales bacterium]|nr:hypothetical protein [Rhodospirillales bacterium]